MTDFAALGLGVEYTTHRVELIHPKTGVPLIDENGEPAFIEIDGMHSDAGAKLKAQAKLRLQQQQRSGRNQTKVDLEADRAENAAALSSLVRSWHLVNIETGKAIPEDAFPCNAANARALFGREQTEWMAKQVGADLLDETNFIKA